MINRIKSQYNYFPKNFWVLSGANFIDRLGGGIIFPFFAIYVSSKFQVGMTTVGILFAIFTVSGFLGGIIGGAVADKIGRKFMVVFGLVFSALSSLAWAFIDDLNVFFVVAAFVGLLDAAGHPASNAMVADIVPKEKRLEGYAMSRVVSNLASTIGPLLGGLILSFSNESYTVLFIGDAITSLITAAIVINKLPETKPEPKDDLPVVSENFGETMKGYALVLKDRMFVLLIVMGALQNFVYIQMYSTLPVWLTNINGYPATTYPNLLAMNAGIVVIFQAWVSRKTSKGTAYGMIGFGTLLYAIGFGMFGFVQGIPLFAVAMIIITIGEMIVLPTISAKVASIAPEDMRGRYMAMGGLMWLIPRGIGPYIAGIIVDNYHPNAVWYVMGIIGVMVAIGFAIINQTSGKDLVNTAEIETATD